jgi:hypothetical protein
MKSGIYCFKNVIDGKKYIGQSVNVYKRHKEHIYGLKKDSHRNDYLQKAFNKYGENAFEFSILEICDIDMLDVRECSWINYYKTTESDFGYNLMGGGHNIHSLSHETKEKIRQSHLGEKNPFFGRKHTEETKKKIKESNLGKTRTEETKKKMSGENNPNYGKHFSEESKLKMRLAKVGKKRTPEHNEKLRLARIGYRPSESTKNKMRLWWENKKKSSSYKDFIEKKRQNFSGSKNPMYGKTISKETILKRNLTRERNKKLKDLVTN